MRIILVGNPNVGKSAVFSYLTGYTAVSSNYPGTTVDILTGKAKLCGFECEVIDVPGCYSLDGESVAEKIASEIVKSGEYDVIFNVVDANNIERNLFLTLELLKINKPLVVIATKTDIAVNRGIEIDYSKLSKMLGVKVFPVIATVGVGFDALERGLCDVLVNKTLPSPLVDVPTNSIERWKIIGEIFLNSVRIVHKHPTFLEKLELITTTPSTAIPFAFVLIIVSFYILRFIAEGIINWLLDPLFNLYYMPMIEKVYSHFSGFLKELLFSKNIAPLEGFSVLTTGVYIPFVVVLPYIFSFYLVLGILEDTGYLPRLAVVLDRLSHKIGLHGYGTLPIIMGLGCKVGGIFSLRILESEREKILASSLMFLIAPCIPQTAVIISVLSKYSSFFSLIFFAYVFSTAIFASYILNKLIKGSSNELFMEIPPYHRPSFRNIVLKTKIRVFEFLKDAVPFVTGGIFFINIFYITGVFDFLSNKAGYFFSKFFSVPIQTVSVIFFGFLKKDVSITLLMPFKLTIKQFMVLSFFLVTYMPCLASIFVLFRELGKKITFYVIVFNFFISFVFTVLFSFILSFFVQ